MDELNAALGCSQMERIEEIFRLLRMWREGQLHYRFLIIWRKSR